MSENRMDRRGFLAAIAAALPFIPGDNAQRKQVQVPANDSVSENKALDHLPKRYEELFRLSSEQKVLLSALTASGCDAVGYYKPAAGGGYALDKHIDLYRANTTAFAKEVGEDIIAGLQKAESVRFDVAKPDGIGENVFFALAVREKPGAPLKGIVVLHASPEAMFLREFEKHKYCQQARLKMAGDILTEHADLFGESSGKKLAESEMRHRELARKEKFFMTLAKDMFSTFTRKGDADPQSEKAVREASDTFALKKALRAWAKENAYSMQYSHVLGVSDGMDCLVDAINKDQVPPIIGKRQKNFLSLLTLLHDIGKTQIPSQLLSERPEKSEIQHDKEFGVARNGSHPLFTLLTMLLYKNDGLTAAAHHMGIDRYGPEERTSLIQRKVVPPGFTNFTELTPGDDINPENLPPLSKMMRLVDVMEAITGRVDLPLHEAVRQLGMEGKPGVDQPILAIYQKVRRDANGTPILNPDTVDPSYLCFAIANGAFEAYGKNRTKETGGWISGNKRNDPEGKPWAGQLKYNPEKLEAVQDEILTRFGWKDKKFRAKEEARIRHEISKDRVLLENPEPGRAVVGAFTAQEAGRRAVNGQATRGA